MSRPLLVCMFLIKKCGISSANVDHFLDYLLQQEIPRRQSCLNETFPKMLFLQISKNIRCLIIICSGKTMGVKALMVGF